ncbi:MAG TPA: hypothetical protein VMZ05_06110 [Spirochaetota bacterium]|nr:hypothetical protein [Spirochaetota bacterium]
MILDDLPFGTFQEIEPNILEIIINEGVELDRDHIERIEEGLLEKYSGAYALLIDWVNSYSHKHDSMEQVVRLQNVAAVAIVIYSEASGTAANIHRLYMDNGQVFEDKARAMTWLRDVMKKSI